MLHSRPYALTPVKTTIEWLPITTIGYPASYPVLVFTGDDWLQEIILAKFDLTTKKFYYFGEDMDEYNEIKGVTHWAKLPTPPTI